MSSESQYSSQQNTGWVQWFCNLQQHQFFCEIDDQFIRDTFNLYGIKQKFSHYNEAMEMILRTEGPDEEQQEDERFIEIYQEATDIYGLIHARWILTPKGLSLMKQKYVLGKFGICPRVLCERQNVLPVGMSEDIRTSRVKVYCPKCQDIFVPKKKCPDVDGAYFGCSFPHVLLMTYEDIRIRINESNYIPRIYGFKIFKQKGSKYEQKKEIQEVSYYSQEHLKKIKGMKEKKPVMGKKLST